MKKLGENMAYTLKSMQQSPVKAPAMEPKAFTNFIR